MKIVGLVPARCGSKGIPFKNIKNFCGEPLIYWVLDSLERSTKVQEVFVATDCKEIANVVERFGFTKVKVYNRSEESANDTASTEMVLLEFIENNSFNEEDLIVLVQATNPFTREFDFDNAIKLLINKEGDSLLTCVRTKRFFWSEDGTPINYDYRSRPRRQEFKGTLMENGAFYINRVSNIKSTRNRLSGKIVIYEMPEYTGVEIDEEDDWYIAEKLFCKYILKQKKNRRVKLFICDVDGTLTDGGIYYSEQGEELKKFNTKDGMAFQLLKSAGIRTGIITKEVSKIVEMRARKLKVDYFYQGVENKLEVVKRICELEKIGLEEVAYIGDDINCIEVLRSVGIAGCPSDAVEEVKSIPGIIFMSKPGGYGAVREFAEFVLKITS